VLALLLLQQPLQSRFAFTRAQPTPEFSDAVAVVAYTERVRPTVVRTVDDRDRPASGRFWIDRTTGGVLQSEMTLTGQGVSIRFRVLFRHDSALGVAVPVRMQEEYVLPGSKLVGVATYSRFRQFRVRTDSQVAEPGGVSK
jgi:hypothetical protein